MEQRYHAFTNGEITEYVSWKDTEGNEINASDGGMILCGWGVSLVWAEAAGASVCAQGERRTGDHGGSGDVSVGGSV